MFKELKENVVLMCEQIENLNRHVEFFFFKEQIEIKSRMIEMESLLDGFNITSEMAEERISKL